MSHSINRRPTNASTPARAVLRWVINIVWIVVWVVLYFLCIKVYGDIAAFIGIPMLIVFMVIVWVTTGRRNQQALEEEAP